MIWPGLVLGGLDAIFAFAHFIEHPEFLAGSAEPHIDVLDRLADFFGDFLYGRSCFSGGIKDRGDMLFEKTLRSALTR